MITLAVFATIIVVVAPSLVLLVIEGDSIALFAFSVAWGWVCGSNLIFWFADLFRRLASKE